MTTIDGARPEGSGPAADTDPDEAATAAAVARDRAAAAGDRAGGDDGDGGGGEGAGTGGAGLVPVGRGARVQTKRLSLRGSQGWVYRGVDLDVEPGHLAAVQGEAGSGRTCLLLTLAGRMTPTDGFARIGNLPLPRQMTKVQRIAALGLVRGVNDLDPALTVGDHVRERLLLHGRLGRRSRVLVALDAAGVDADPRMLVRELDQRRRKLLGIAVALVGDPRVLLIDDVDAGLPAGTQRQLWRDLRGVSRTGVTVVATCHELAPAAGLTDAVIRLPEPADPEPARPAQVAEPVEPAEPAEPAEAAGSTGPAGSTDPGGPAARTDPDHPEAADARA